MGYKLFDSLQTNIQVISLNRSYVVQKSIQAYDIYSTSTANPKARLQEQIGHRALNSSKKKTYTKTGFNVCRNTLLGDFTTNNQTNFEMIRKNER